MPTAKFIDSSINISFFSNQYLFFIQKQHSLSFFYWSMSLSVSCDSYFIVTVIISCFKISFYVSSSTTLFSYFHSFNSFIRIVTIICPPWVCHTLHCQLELPLLESGLLFLFYWLLVLVKLGIAKFAWFLRVYQALPQKTKCTPPPPPYWVLLPTQKF